MKSNFLPAANSQSCSRSTLEKVQLEGNDSTDRGLTSTAVTVDWGFSLEKDRAHAPEPQPASSTSSGRFVSNGATYRAPSKVINQCWCWRSAASWTLFTYQVLWLGQGIFGVFAVRIFSWVSDLAPDSSTYFGSDMVAYVCLFGGTVDILRGSCNLATTGNGCPALTVIRAGCGAHRRGQEVAWRGGGRVDAQMLRKRLPKKLEGVTGSFEGNLLSLARKDLPVPLDRRSRGTVAGESNMPL
nr:hypothetical protein CFP56_65481 [Quercus suber]